MFRLCWWFWGCCLGCEGGGVVYFCSVRLDLGFEAAVCVVSCDGGGVVVYFGGVLLDLGFEDAVLVVSCDGGGLVAYFVGIRLDLGFEDAVCWCSDAW